MGFLTRYKCVHLSKRAEHVNENFTAQTKKNRLDSDVHKVSYD